MTTNPLEAMSNRGAREWLRSGSPGIWLNAAALATSLIMVLGLLGLIAVRGLGHFWPADVQEVQVVDGSATERVIGELHDEEDIPVHTDGADKVKASDLAHRFLFKTGNRDLSGLDFRWIAEADIQSMDTPEEIMVLERREWGNAYGYPRALLRGEARIADGGALTGMLATLLDETASQVEQIREIERGRMGDINYALEQLRLEERRRQIREASDNTVYPDIQEERAALRAEFAGLETRLRELYTRIGQESLLLETANGQTLTIPLAKIVDAYQPNAMGILAKSWHYLGKIWEFVSDDPREANTEGGIFPAIFGTVVMVIVMSIVVTPAGVLAAVYLREYAKQGVITRTVRIAVNNLAGVPSIVYGVFGLGFFVYFIGGSIDDLFYPEAKPAPVFGTPGLLWSSLTLALLTLPVVIVSTEEGLARVPRNIREGSLALGATQFETLWRTVLPMASPAMMTGLILAIARAAGEVAPLMLVGVVKLAPTLPVDLNAPFVHLDRKFMHLGFHIYDVGFQSPNVEAARPLVYATALLLVVVIVLLNLVAIGIRNHLREKYRALDH